jgi:hypothetical protein
MPIKARALIVIIQLACAGAFAADEITVSASLSLSSGAVLQSQKSGDVVFDMTNAAPRFSAGILAVGVSPTALPVGSVNAPGYAWLKNVSTNYWVDAGPTNAGAILPTVRLGPGEVFQGPLAPGAAIFFAGPTNDVGLQYFLITR